MEQEDTRIGGLMGHRELRDELMDLVHNCGYCSGGPQTERCEPDVIDLRIADRVTAYVLNRERALGLHV